MAETVRDLIVNGITLPTPKHQGVTISTNKIWSANTGRTTSGKMVGTIVATKAKLQITWPPLTEAQVSLIEAAVSDKSTPFFTVSYTDMKGNTVSRTMYAGDITYSQYSWSEGLRYVTDVAVSLIEQ